MSPRSPSRSTARSALLKIVDLKAITAIAKQRELLDMQSRDIDNRLGRLRDDMSSQREEGQSRLKIIHVALAGLGVTVVGLLALVLVTM